MEVGKLGACPKVPRLQEPAPRSGFFDRQRFDGVLAHLDPQLRPPMTFAYITGWRVNSEVLPLEWHRVDFKANEVRLARGTTKNGEGRVFKMTRELRMLLESQDAERERLRKAGHIVPFVFFREVAEGRGGEKPPQPIVSLLKVWKKACRLAGAPAAFLMTCDGRPCGISCGLACPKQSPCG